MLFLTYLLVIFCFSSQCLIPIAQSQLITEPPRNTSAPLGRNATFSCCGNGDLVWEISGTQIRSEDQIETFAVTRKIYSPIHQANSTEVFITATTDNNGTTVECLLGPAIGTVRERSAVVKLLVYAEPYPPSDLVIEVNGLNLVVTWTEPFSLEGEEISYVVSITNVNSKRHIHETVHNTTRFVLDDSVIPGPRNCSDYDIGVFSKNGYGQSTYGILGRKPLPTVPPVMGKADVKINIILTGSNTVHAEVMFNPRDPCTAYPVTRYNFTVTERTNPSNTHFVTYTSDASLILDGDNVGLEPDRVYRLSIEAVNSVGRTLSEEILLYTTGLQSSSAVMELDGSITVTCTFATGASSTGCQVTIFNTDNTQVEILSENINRQNENTNMVTGSFNLLKSTEPEVVTLLLEVSEIRVGGGTTDALFNISLPFNNTPNEVILPVRNAAGGVSSSVIGAVVSVAVMFVIIVVLVIIIIFIVVRHRSTRRNPVCIPETLSIDHLELKPNDTYGINLRSLSMSHPDHSHYDTPRPQLTAAAVNSTDGASTVVDDIKPKPNEVYGVNRESLLKLKIDWNSEGAGDDQSDAHYSYVGMERATPAVYDTIDTRRPSNKYVKS